MKAGAISAGMLQAPVAEPCTINPAIRIIKEVAGIRFRVGPHFVGIFDDEPVFEGDDKFRKIARGSEDGVIRPGMKVLSEKPAAFYLTFGASIALGALRHDRRVVDDRRLGHSRRRKNPVLKKLRIAFARNLCDDHAEHCVVRRAVAELIAGRLFRQRRELLD